MTSIGKNVNIAPGGVKVSSELVRKNIRMSEQLAEWYEVRAAEMGVSQSALMAMALDAYVKQEETIDMMSNFDKLVQELKKLKE